MDWLLTIALIGVSVGILVFTGYLLYRVLGTDPLTDPAGDPAGDPSGDGT